MKARTTDIQLYTDELNGQAKAGATYSTLLKEACETCATYEAAKALASRRWNLANKAYWRAA